MRIGELAHLTGTSVRSLRYYEERGLLDAQRSTAGAHRIYAPGAVSRVRLLRQLFSAGLSSAVIASILPCVDTPTMRATAESLEIMTAEHSRLGDQIQTLTETREQLDYLISVARRHLPLEPLPPAVTSQSHRIS